MYQVKRPPFDALQRTGRQSFGPNKQIEKYYRLGSCSKSLSFPAEKEQDYRPCPCVCLTFCCSPFVPSFLLPSPFPVCSSLHSFMSSFLPLIILNGLLVLLNAGPLYWQFLQGNSGAISMGVWVMIANVNGFVRSFAQHGAPVLTACSRST